MRSPRRATGFARDDGRESIDTPAAGALCKAGTRATRRSSGRPGDGISSRDGWANTSARGGAVIEHPRSGSGFRSGTTREKHSACGGRKSRLGGVAKRVGRRHALLSPLRQAIPAGAALLIWNVSRLGWPALHGIDLDRLALQRPVLQERPHGGSIRRLVRSTLESRFFTSPGT